MKKRAKLCAVLRVTQSPMNAVRWVLDLACGHQAWVTSYAKPRVIKKACDICTEEEARSARATCKHEDTVLGEVYEHCDDCGAVRRRVSGDPWHTCDKCRW